MQVPSQLLAATAPQPATEIQYIQPPTLPSGPYVQYQTTGGRCLTQQIPQHSTAQFASRAAAAAAAAAAADPFQQSLCMSSVILTQNGLQGKPPGREGCGRGVRSMRERILLDRYSHNRNTLLEHKVIFCLLLKILNLNLNSFTCLVQCI